MMDETLKEILDELNKINLKINTIENFYIGYLINDPVPSNIPSPKSVSNPNGYSYIE